MGGPGLINMTQYSDGWHAVVCTVMNTLVSYTWRNFLSGRPNSSVTKLLCFLEFVSLILLWRSVISQTISAFKQSFLKTVYKYNAMFLPTKHRFAGIICNSCTITMVVHIFPFKLDVTPGYLLSYWNLLAFLRPFRDLRQHSLTAGSSFPSCWQVRRPIGLAGSPAGASDPSFTSTPHVGVSPPGHYTSCHLLLLATACYSMDLETNREIVKYVPRCNACNVWL
jgi:hypothetical protein